MPALFMSVMRRPRRRTHLIMSGADLPACGTRTALTGAEHVPVDLIGGATYRLRVDLVRELNNDDTCARCARIAGAMLALYVARDTGRAW
jgi:hypothetical protein